MGISDHFSCFSTKLTFYVVYLINVQELYMYGKKCVINRVNNLNTTFPRQNVTFVGYAHITNILFLDLVSISAIVFSFTETVPLQYQRSSGATFKIIQGVENVWKHNFILVVKDE